MARILEKLARRLPKAFFFRVCLPSWFWRKAEMFERDLPQAIIFVVFALLVWENIGNIWTRLAQSRHFYCVSPPAFGEIWKYLDSAFRKRLFPLYLPSWLWRGSKMVGRDLPKFIFFVVSALLVLENVGIIRTRPSQSRYFRCVCAPGLGETGNI